MSVSWGQPSYGQTWAKTNYNRSPPTGYNPQAAKAVLAYQMQQAPLGAGTSRNARTTYASNYHSMLNNFGKMSIKGGKKTRRRHRKARKTRHK